MHHLTMKVSTELDILHSLYQLAFDYTLKVKLEKNEEMLKWINIRQRILGKSDKSSKTVEKQLKQFKASNQIPAKERALIEEKKNQIKDLSTSLRKNEFTLLNKLHYKKGALRTEIAQLSRKKTAINAYAKAPKASMLIS